MMAGGSCLIEGHAGAGKSHFVRECLAELSKSKQCVLLAKTHVAANNTSSGELVGQTCDAFTRTHAINGSFAGGGIWLDEHTVLDVQQYTLLNAMYFGENTQLIKSDNHAQMGACFPTFRGVPIEAG